MLRTYLKVIYLVTMKAITRFFNTALYSMGSTEFYKNLKDMPLKSSINYFIELILVTSIGMAMVQIITGIIVVNEIRSISSQIVADLPENFELRQENEQLQLSSNVNEPIVIDIPTDFFDEGYNLGGVNFIVIDTQIEPSEAEKEYTTFFLISKDGISIWEGTVGQYEPSFSLADFGVSEVSKQSIENLLNQFDSFYVPALIIIVVLFVPLAILLSFVGAFFMLVIYSCIVYIIGKMKPYRFGSNKKIFQFGMHLMTITILIRTIVSIVPVGLPVWLINLALFPLVAVLFIPREERLEN